MGRGGACGGFRKEVTLERKVSIRNLAEMACANLSRGGANVHFPNVHFVLCSLFSARFLALTTLRPPSMSSSPPPLLSIACTLSELSGQSRAPRRVNQCRDVTKNKVHVRNVHVCHPLSYSNTAALHSVARFQDLEGVSQENRATRPEKVPVAPTFSALEGVVALQVAS